jgi:hypothetical protein
MPHHRNSQARAGVNLRVEINKYLRMPDDEGVLKLEIKPLSVAIKQVIPAAACDGHALAFDNPAGPSWVGDPVIIGTGRGRGGLQAHPIRVKVKRTAVVTEQVHCSVTTSCGVLTTRDVDLPGPCVTVHSVVR